MGWGGVWDERLSADREAALGDSDGVFLNLTEVPEYSGIGMGTTSEGGDEGGDEGGAEVC